MSNILFRWKYPRSPLYLDLHFDNIPLAWAFPDVPHYHVIPRSAHLFASVEAFQVVEANHHHDLLKDEVMT